MSIRKVHIRPLLLAGDNPIAEVDTAHGLRALIYPPAPGLCTCCSRRAEWILKEGLLCAACDALCEGDGCNRAATA
jgi:hypothetical protein